MRSVSIGGLLVLSVALLVSGCSTGQAVTNAQEATDLDYGSPNELPLESYFIDTKPYGAAIDDYVVDCMGEAGFDYPVAELDLSRREPQAYTRLMYPVLAEGIAAEFGYRDEPDPRIISPKPPSNDAAPSGAEEAYHSELQSCIEASVDVVPDFSEAGNVVLALDAESRKSADSDLAVRRSIESWRECMIGRGVIEDVDGTPEELRVATLLRMDKKYHPGVQDTMTLPPSANEVNIASTDSLCREDSGYSRAYYTAVGRAQERLVVENADALEDVESTVADITVVVDEYVMRDTR